jgi:predicted deacylase
VSAVFRLEAPYRGEYLLHRLSFGGGGGPTVALVAGVHGNEVNGLYALNLVAGVLSQARPKGLVHVIPCVNTLGADEARKRWPFDDRDIGEAFPGDAEGTAVERIAKAVMDATDAELCIDVQSGQPVVHECPHVRSPLGARELQAARALGLPVTWKRPSDRFEGTLVGAWRDAGRTGLAVRGGRGSTLDVVESKVMARALVRVLSATGVLPGEDPAPRTLETDHVREYRTEAGGFFVPEVAPGARVNAAALLGTVRAPLGGELVERVEAQRPGIVLASRVYPMVSSRELVMRVAEEPAQ